MKKSNILLSINFFVFSVIADNVIFDSTNETSLMDSNNNDTLSILFSDTTTVYLPQSNIDKIHGKKDSIDSTSQVNMGCDSSKLILIKSKFWGTLQQDSKRIKERDIPKIYEKDQMFDLAKKYRKYKRIKWGGYWGCLGLMTISVFTIRNRPRLHLSIGMCGLIPFYIGSYKQKKLRLEYNRRYCQYQSENNILVIPDETQNTTIDSSEYGSIRITAIPNTSGIYVNDKFVGKKTKLLNNLAPGLYKIKVKSDIRSRSKKISMTPGQNIEVTLNTEYPTFIIAPGWDYDISKNDFVTGPSCEIGIKIKNHSFCAAYKWCFLPLREEIEPIDYNHHSYFGGGFHHYNEIIKKGKFSMFVGEVVGFWSYADQTHKQFEPFKASSKDHFYYLFGGPTCGIKFGLKKTYFIAKYTLLMGFKQIQDEGSIGFDTSFGLKNTIRTIIWFEL